MKILQIIYSLSSGGAERFVVDLSNEFIEQGHDVVLCTIRDDKVEKHTFYKNELSSKISYKNLAIKHGFNFQYTKKIYQLIHAEKPDVVHCHLNLVNYVFPISLIKRRLRFFYTVHNDAFKELQFKFELPYRKFFLSRASFKVITISKETSESFRECYKIDNFTEIYNGRKKPEKSKGFGKVCNEIQELRKENKTIFLHVARFSAQKNQQLLVNVFNRLFSNGEDVVLLIIGDGFNTEDGQKLQASSEKHIHYLGPKHNVADYYFNADAFCLTSHHEGMPITLIESLACGCVPICTPVGGVKNSIKNGENGFLAESVSEQAFYNAVKIYLDNRKKIKNEKLTDQFTKRFGIKQCANKYIELYSKVIS